MFAQKYISACCLSVYFLGLFSRKLASSMHFTHCFQASSGDSSHSVGHRWKNVPLIVCTLTCNFAFASSYIALGSYFIMKTLWLSWCWLQRFTLNCWPSLSETVQHLQLGHLLQRKFVIAGRGSQQVVGVGKRFVVDVIAGLETERSQQDCWRLRCELGRGLWWWKTRWGIETIKRGRVQLSWILWSNLLG